MVNLSSFRLQMYELKVFIKGYLARICLLKYLLWFKGFFSVGFNLFIVKTFCQSALLSYHQCIYRKCISPEDLLDFSFLFLQLILAASLGRTVLSNIKVTLYAFWSRDRLIAALKFKANGANRRSNANSRSSGDRGNGFYLEGEPDVRDGRGDPGGS